MCSRKNAASSAYNSKCFPNSHHSAMCHRSATWGLLTASQNDSLNVLRSWDLITILLVLHQRHSLLKLAAQLVRMWWQRIQWPQIELMPFSWVVLRHQSYYPALVLCHQHRCQHGRHRRNHETQKRLSNTVWAPLRLLPSLHRRSSSTRWCWLQISASETACRGTSRDCAIPKAKVRCVRK